MGSIDKVDFMVLVKDVKKNLYLRCTPLYRGLTRWNKEKKFALRFADMEEAEAAVESLEDNTIDISYELVPKTKTETEGKNFSAEIVIDDEEPVVVHWTASDALAIFDLTVKLAKRAKGALQLVVIREKETLL